MTSPVLMPAGHAIVAADLDAYEAATAAWATYTPVWGSNGTQPAIGNGTITGRYRRVGKTVTAFIKMTIGASTTFGTGIYTWSLPTPARGTFQASGCATVDDSGTALFIGNVVPVISASTVSGYQPVSPNGSYFDPTHPMTWAVNDFVCITITYEAA